MSKQIFSILFIIVVSISWIDSRSFKSYYGNDENIIGTSLDRFRQQMLQAHNKYRSRHCVPPLQLRDRISLSAQIAAEKLARTQGKVYINPTGFGQNIFVKTSTAYLGYINGQEPTDQWYNGIQYYDFNQEDPSIDALSFTQVVWAKTQQIGIGIAYTRDHRTAYVVVQYFPAGNYENQYQNNVFPAQC